MRRVALIAGLASGACASAACAARSAAPDASPSASASARASEAAPGSLPPIPLVEGALALRVVYPTMSSLVASRDSNFIFGSVGNGRATLTINGVPVTVRPNGSYLAYLPIPPDSAPRYDLVATLGPDTQRVSHPVRLPPPRPPLPLVGPLAVDTLSIVPRGGPVALRDDEPVRVSVRAPANATVWVRMDGDLRRLLVDEALRTPKAAPSPDSGTVWATDVPARLLRERPELLVARGRDTLRLALARIGSVAADPPAAALLGVDSGSVYDTDRVVIARPTPAGTYKWFLLPGTQVELTGRSGEFSRVRFDATLEAWVTSNEVRPLPLGSAVTRRVAGSARLVPSADWVDLVIPVGERPPFGVEEREQSLLLTLHGVRSGTDLLTYGGNDSLVRVVRWEQETTDRVRYTLHLSEAPYGYLALWDRGSFVLRVRRRPRVDARAPLRGILVAVDAGHPPLGATGPTGLWEPVATLSIAQRVRALLEARGATVVMTRTSAAPVPLNARPAMARRANAHALVSIHLNALPDGVNPFTAHGTGTYFFHPHSEPLARAVQNGMVATMGLRNLGVYYDNLALVRPTWMPAVLCEGAFLMIPEQEAAVRTPEFQEAYARGVVAGVESYFRSMSR